MLLKNTIIAVIFGRTLVSLPAFGQDNPTSKADIRIEASMPFVESRNSDRAQQSATVNYGFPGGYRFFFNTRSGVKLSYGYTHNIHMYSLENGSIALKNNPDEVLPAHVFPFPAKRQSPFVLAGVGGLTFDPKTVVGTSTQTRLMYRYGGSGDFTLKHRIVPRTKHRGVFYNSATFNIDGQNSLDRFPNREEPSVVFGYNF